MLLKDLKWTSRLGMSSCTVREPMTLQAEHLGIRFYPYPLVYAIGGHAKPSQRRERVEETQTAPLYILRESENDLKWPKKFSKRKISGVQISSSNYLGWCGSPLSNRGAGLWESWQKSRVRWKLEFCGQVLDVENQCHLALWWMEVMMSLFSEGLLTVPHVQGADSVAARKFSFDWIFKVLVYLAKLFLWQQDGSNVVPCVVATLYIFVGWWHWGGWRPCKPMHTERTCAPKNLGMGPRVERCFTWAWPGTLAVRYCILDCICPAAQVDSDRGVYSWSVWWVWYTRFVYSRRLCLTVSCLCSNLLQLLASHLGHVNHH